MLMAVLCPRPHVCAEQELTLVGRRQPCVRAFSRTVPVWKPGCGRQAWCVSHERRYVGRVRERGLCTLRPGGRAAGSGAVCQGGPRVGAACTPDLLPLICWRTRPLSPAGGEVP